MPVYSHPQRPNQWVEPCSLCNFNPWRFLAPNCVLPFASHRPDLATDYAPECDQGSLFKWEEHSSDTGPALHSHLLVLSSGLYIVLISVHWSKCALMLRMALLISITTALLFTSALSPLSTTELEQEAALAKHWLSRSTATRTSTGDATSST